MTASALLRISITLQNASSGKEPFCVGAPTSALTNCFLARQPPRRCACLSCSSRRRGRGNPAVASRKVNKKKVARESVGEEEDIDEDAFEALFRQLEEDLKNDELPGHDGGDDDISEEDLAKLEQELAEALEDDELFGALGSIALDETKNEDGGGDDDVADDEDGSEVEYDNDEEEEMPVKLKSWQLRRLAYALKKGRRKTSIKNLAADLCLDRAIVLKLLRDPPPNLIMMSAALPDKPETIILDPVEEKGEPVPEEMMTHALKPVVNAREPVHVMQSNWAARKRLKKAQVETLEQVYNRTKRPTNAMISSIVHVTNVPRKRVLKWFEDKRAEEGIPEKRRPYERSAHESVFTS